MSLPHKISIVVPVYNSSQTIFELVARIETALNTNSLNYEVILVDDCSTDESWQVIKKICSSNRKIIGLRLSKNSGQWCSTLAGMSRTSGKYIITIDDDLEYDPNDILKLYKVIATNNYSVVFGMANNKYLMQGKNRFSKWRKELLRFFWHTAPTDSFKILVRELVFKGEDFLPDILLDAFIEHNLDKIFWGYAGVNFNKRYAGASNHSFFKKVKLFFLYCSHYFLKIERLPPYAIVEELNIGSARSNT